ncbi:MAG: type IX secretion system protein PorQ, partial [Chitinophagales bacterium]
KDLSLSHAIMAGNINHGYLAYGDYLDSAGLMLHTGLLYRSYGQMILYDNTGMRTGTFHANEFALLGGISYQSDKLSYGFNLKFIWSQLESYSSIAGAVDLGVAYNDTANLFSAGLVLKNIGTQFKPYVSGNREELPFEIQLGISQKLRYLPLRLSVTAHNLQQADIRYDDPNAIATNNILNPDTASSVEKKYIADKIFRHLIFSGEFYFGKNLTVQLAYDHMTRKELSLSTTRGLTGFSIGMGVNIKKYTFHYSYDIYSVAGGSHMFTLSTNLHYFNKM